MCDSFFSHVDFYKYSLSETDYEIEEGEKSGKALKDRVGLAFENHRRRIWEHFGFEVRKRRELAKWDADWSVYWKGKLVVQEEDKAHYVDSCFHIRAICEFAKTIESYLSNGVEVPLLLLHSFTTYKKYQEKLDELKPIFAPEILAEMEKKVRYTSLVKRDRLPKEHWFPKSNDCYALNADTEMIEEDIRMILSLIPKQKESKKIHCKLKIVDKL